MTFLGSLSNRAEAVLTGLDLFVPGLFAELLPAAMPRGPGRWPALERLLARADFEIPQPCAVETRLCQAFGLAPQGSGTPPVADLTALHDLAGGDPRGGFVRADPVHLRAGAADLVLFDAPSLDLTAPEADALLAYLNAGLGEHGLALVRGAAPTRWYAAVDCGPDFRSFSPGSIRGRAVTAYLPAGRGAPFLRRVMNDAQMLLHRAAVNAERQTRGALPVNSVWLWGGGALAAPSGTRPDMVVGDDVLAAGLAKRYGSIWLERAEDVPGLLAGIPAGQTVLAVVGAPTGATGEAARATLDALETQWFGPLLLALQRHRLRRLRILTDRAVFVLGRRSLRRFWRRVRTLDVVRDALPGRAPR